MEVSQSFEEAVLLLMCGVWEEGKTGRVCDLHECRYVPNSLAVGL